MFIRFISHSQYSRLARRLDDSLDVLEVAMQRFAAHLREPVLGPWPAALEGLRTVDIAGFFQLARVRAQVAVAHLEQLLQLIERKLLIDRERTHDAQPHALIHQPIKLGVLGRTGRNGHTPACEPGRPARESRAAVCGLQLYS